MKLNFQTVYYNGSPLMMGDAAMTELGWQDGRAITREEMAEGIKANARALCRDIEQRTAQGGEDIDITRLAELCDY